MRLVLLFFVALILFSGCADQLPQPDENYPPNLIIKTAKIRPIVFITDKPFVQTPEGVWLSALTRGVISNMDGTNEQRFTEFLKENNIDIKEIVVNSFKERLSSPDSPIVLSQDSADVEIELHILLYGIHGAGPFSVSEYEPMLNVGANIYYNREHILTVNKSFEFPSEEQVPPRSMEEYYESPALLVEGYATLSNIIADSLIQQLAPKSLNDKENKCCSTNSNPSDSDYY